MKEVLLPTLVLFSANFFFSELMARCPTDEEVMSFVQDFPRKNRILDLESGESWLTSQVPDWQKFDCASLCGNLIEVEKNQAETNNGTCAYNLFYKPSAHKANEPTVPLGLLTFIPNPCPSIGEVRRFITENDYKPACGKILEAVNGQWVVDYAPNYNDRSELNRIDFTNITDVLYDRSKLQAKLCGYNVFWLKSASASPAWAHDYRQLIFRKK